MSTHLLPPTAYDEEALAIYHTTLRFVRHDLRNTCHIIDSRTYAQHPTSLVGTLLLIEELEDASLPVFFLPAPNLSDAVTSDDTTRALIDSLVSSPTVNELHSLADEAILSSVRTTKYLELPLLSSSHAQDFQNFLCDNSPGSRPNPIHTSVLPCEPVDHAEDGGLMFPQRAHHLLSHIEEQIARESIDPTEEDLLRIAEALYVDNRDDTIHQLVMDGLPPIGTRSHSITPPILQFDEDEDAMPVDLIQPNAELYVPSDPVSLLDDDLNQVRRKLFAESPVQATHTLLPTTPPELDVLPFSQPSFVKMSDLVREPPLLSEPDSSISGSIGTDWFQSNLDPFQYLVNQSVHRDPACSEDGCETRQACENLSEITLRDEELGRILEQSTAQVLCQLEQERPEVKDSIARLSVPKLDFSVPEPEWMGTRHANEMFGIMLRDWVDSLQLWPRNRCEEKLLRWTPFPSRVASPNLHESLGNYEELSLHLNISSPGPLEEDFQSGDFCFKILRHKDDDMISTDILADEESPTIPAEYLPTPSSIPAPPVDNLMELVRKRKTRQPETTCLSNKRMTPSKGLVENTGSLFLSDHDRNVTRRLLSNYIEMQAPGQPKSRAHPFASASEKLLSAPQFQVYEKKTSSPNIWSPASPRPDPCPDVDAPAGPVRFIISATIPRQLIYGFQKYFRAGVDLLDRDFSASSLWASSSKSASLQDGVSPLSYEADMAVSPSTGILVTTIIKVCQKPIPGSGDMMSQVRMRIANVVPLYERLIVLVWQDAHDDSSAVVPLSATEARAYSEFAQKNSAVPDTNIETTYIGGGSRNLVNRAISVVCQHISNDLQHLLNEDEMEWEVILRRAGMNIYAAQVLVASLRREHGEEGMDRFMQMPTPEKMEKFEALLGGRAVLDRVCARLERGRN